MFIYEKDDARFAYELYFKEFKEKQSAINVFARSEYSREFANVDIFKFENSYLVVQDLNDYDCLLYDDLDEVLYCLKQFFENFKESFLGVEIDYRIIDEDFYNDFSFEQRIEFLRVVG